MVVKLYISGISGNKEVKKKQQRVQMILDSKQISYEAIDITEPGKEKDKEFMQQNGKVRESLGKYPLPPQIFNDESFCGDYEDFDLANEVDELEKFLHIETKDLENGSKVNGVDEEIIELTKPNEDNEGSLENHQMRINGIADEVTDLELPPRESVEETKENNVENSNQSPTNELNDVNEERVPEETAPEQNLVDNKNAEHSEQVEDEKASEHEDSEEKKDEKEENDDEDDEEKEQDE